MSDKGYRIRHKSLKSCLVTVPDITRPLSPRHCSAWKCPYFNTVVHGRHCPTCNLHHLVKTYHLNLDSDGACIISKTVLENLKRIKAVDSRDGDVRYINEVANPPVQHMAVGMDKSKFTLKMIRKREAARISQGQVRRRNV